MIESLYDKLQALDLGFSSKILGSSSKQWRVEVRHSMYLLGEEKL